MSKAKTTTLQTVGPESEMTLVRFTQEHLTLDNLQNTLRAVEAQAGNAKAGVILDFTGVDEWVGAWSLHLALIVYLARKLRKPVRICGLHGQPLSVAWLYRRDPEIRDLLGVSHSQSESRAA